MFSSKGCATCRSRRIRCDRALPKCQRCVASNRLCVIRDDDSSRSPSTERSLEQEKVRGSEALCRPAGPARPGMTLDSHHPMIQWRNGKEPFMQTAIDHFLTNFVFNAEDLSLLVGRGSIEVFDIVPAERGPGRTVVDTLDAMTTGLLMIRAASLQTIEQRREQHTKYRTAMQNLRESISLYPDSRRLIAPIYLFALYEMIVNTSTDDKTWQIHLNGLLAMLQQSCKSRDGSTVATSNLIAARKFGMSDNGDLQEFFRSRNPIEDIEKVWLILDISKMRLRKLIGTMDEFRVSKGGSFKKLDVEKLRVSVKLIQRDLRIITELVPREYRPVRMSTAAVYGSDSGLPSYYSGYYGESYSNDFVCGKWNEYRAMLLITCDFLLKAAQFLYSGTSRPNARESTMQSRMVKEAVDGICASVAFYYAQPQLRTVRSSGSESPAILSPEQGEGENEYTNIGKDYSSYMAIPMTTMNALNLMWPLHCAIGVEYVTPEPQRDWMKHVLYYTGAQMRIPKAMALASAPAQEFLYSEVLAGLTLLGSGILSSM